MKKKLLAAALAACLTVAMVVPTLAADVTVPVPTTSTVLAPAPGKFSNIKEVEDTKANGAADMITGNVELSDDVRIKDDTDTSVDTDTDTAFYYDIDVSAVVMDAKAKVNYYIDIEWGGMAFAFGFTSKVWDPVDHVYINLPAGSPVGEWLEDNTTIKYTGEATYYYLDGINNKVTVINHSNAAVNPVFDYDMLPGNGTNLSLFNAAAGLNLVVGGFYYTNAAALTGAGILTGTAITAPAPNHLVMLPLYTADGRSPGHVVDVDGVGLTIDDIDPLNPGLVSQVYFAFSGTPDVVPATPTDPINLTLTKVGTITVTLTPNGTAMYNTKGTDTY